MWEPDTQPEHFHPNLAVVLCKGVFDNARDPGLMHKVCHCMTIARVPDCIKLLPFNQVQEAFNRYNEATTRVGLVQLHQSNEIFPDIYFQYYGEHFTIMGLSDPEIRFGMADEFVGGYLVCQHMAASGWRAHAMLPPWLRAGGHSSNSLSHILVLPWWYRISGAASAHPCYLPGSEGKVHSEPGEILHWRSSGQRVAI